MRDTAMCDSSWSVVYAAICGYKAKALKGKNVHVHIDKFQVLRRNDCTPNFRSYVCFVNEAQCVSCKKNNSLISSSLTSFTS